MIRNENSNQDNRQRSVERKRQLNSSFQNKLKTPAALGVPGDEVVASIQAPVGDKYAHRKSQEKSYERKKSSEREVIQYNQNYDKKSGYEDVSDDGKSKKSKKSQMVASRVDKKNSKVSQKEQDQKKVGSKSQQSVVSQKCPFWLKMLIGFITLVAFIGLGYWFFFKRGKTQNKVKIDTKQIHKDSKTHPIPITDSKTASQSPSKIQKTTIVKKQQLNPHKSEAIASETIKQTKKQVGQDGAKSEIKQTKIDTKANDVKQIKQTKEVKQVKPSSESAKPNQVLTKQAQIVEKTIKHLRSKYL